MNPNAELKARKIKVKLVTDIRLYILMFTVCPYILLFKMTSLNNVLVWCQGLQVTNLQFIGFVLRGLHIEEVLYMHHNWHSSRSICSEF